MKIISSTVQMLFYSYGMYIAYVALYKDFSGGYPWHPRGDGGMYFYFLILATLCRFRLGYFYGRFLEKRAALLRPGEDIL